MKGKYAQDCIPFEQVLKKNFILQEQVCNLKKALTKLYK